MPRDGEVDDPGVPASLTDLDGLRSVSSSSAESLHDALSDDFGQSGWEAKSPSQRVLPVPPDDRVERHKKGGLVQTPLGGNKIRRVTATEIEAQ